MLAYGGPECLEQVEPFLRRIMAPREPTPETVARAVGRYARIGGRSPLAENTRAQARALEERLSASGASASGVAGEREFRTVVGMRHATPFVADAVAEAARLADRSVVVVILASHQSERATGGYLRDVASAFEALPRSERARLREPLVVGPWHVSPPFLQAVAGRIEEARARLAARAGGTSPLVVFTAHSLPVSGDRGDPEYERGLLETIEGVVSLLRPRPGWVLAYQSASTARGGRWLGPDVEDEMRRLAGEGLDRVVVMPLGFVSEHLETLYDLDVGLAGVAAEVGVVMERAETVQDSPGLMDALAEAVYEAVERADAGSTGFGRPTEVRG